MQAKQACPFARVMYRGASVAVSNRAFNMIHFPALFVDYQVLLQNSPLHPPSICSVHFLQNTGRNLSPNLRTIQLCVISIIIIMYSDGIYDFSVDCNVVFLVYNGTVVSPSILWIELTQTLHDWCVCVWFSAVRNFPNCIKGRISQFFQNVSDECCFM